MDKNFMERNDMTLVYKDKKPGHIPPPNYIVDEKLPYVFHPQMPECKFRRPTKALPSSGCGACPSFRPLICDKYKKGVTALTCCKCKSFE